MLNFVFYKDSNTYYEIEYSDTFDPIKYNEDLTQWFQIPKTVFDAHYNNIMNIISNIMNK